MDEWYIHVIHNHKLLFFDILFGDIGHDLQVFLSEHGFCFFKVKFYYLTITTFLDSKIFPVIFYLIYSFNLESLFVFFVYVCGGVSVCLVLICLCVWSVCVWKGDVKENTRKPLIFWFCRGYKMGILARNGLMSYPVF